MMSYISLTLLNLKLEYRFKADDFYRCYIQYLPLLLSDAITWSFSLVALFYHALPLNLQDAIVKDRYRLPHLSLFLTKSSQATVLQNLREHAIIVHKNLADESKRIKQILSSHLLPRLQSTLIDSTNYHYSHAQAEETIVQHCNLTSNVDSSSKPLVVKEDGQSYPKNSTNGYISRYPNGVFGNLDCGASRHQFTECKDNRVNTVRSLYW